MKNPIYLLLALLLGGVTGLTLHRNYDSAWLQILVTQIAEPVGQIFLRLIFMIVVPMVFSALVLGVYELGKGRHLKQTAIRTLAFTALSSSLAVFIGVFLVTTFQPGKNFHSDSAIRNLESVQSIQKNAMAAKPFAKSIVEIIPKNPLDSAARALEGEMIPFMFFALCFGLALSMSATRRGSSRTIDLLEEVFETCLTIIHAVMKMAPIAVFCLVFVSTVKLGASIFASLLFYAAIVVIGLLLQQFVVYSALLKIFTKRSPWEFFKTCREVYLYAFATASSNATLPRSLDIAENKLKLTPEKSRFVLTVGSTANQNGTALFEGITVLFLAQVYGIDLTFAQQIQVVVMSIVAGIGTAGVPGGSLPLIMILLQQVGIPVEALGLVLGIDRFLDMCRTTVNVSGDLVIAALVDETT